jgi:predicted small metal-binding protein
MTMRTIECNHCGEPLTAVDDESLAARLLEHAEQVHPDAGVSEDEAQRQVAEQAYSATDN